MKEPHVTTDQAPRAPTRGRFRLRAPGRSAACRAPAQPDRPHSESDKRIHRPTPDACEGAAIARLEQPRRKHEPVASATMTVSHAPPAPRASAPRRCHAASVTPAARSRSTRGPPTRPKSPNRHRNSPAYDLGIRRSRGLCVRRGTSRRQAPPLPRAIGTAWQADEPRSFLVTASAIAALRQRRCLSSPPVASSRTATSCLCRGRHASGRSGASVRGPQRALSARAVGVSSPGKAAR